MNSGNPADVAAYLNEEFRREIKKHKTPRDNRPLEYGVGPLFAAASARGGDNAYGGIFWYDHQRELAKPDPRIKQIFGHTPVPGPLRRDLWNNINIESGCWVFDTAKNDFVMLDEKR
jgi:hypothetical protein